MPPSINAAYRNISVPGVKGRAKTKEYRMFELAVATWVSSNPRQMQSMRLLCEGMDRTKVLFGQYRFYFPANEIIMQSDGKPPKAKPWDRPRRKGEPKRNDTSNRIKCLEDALMKAVGFDDSFIWSAHYTKVPRDPNFPLSFVDLKFDLVNPLITNPSF